MKRLLQKATRSRLAVRIAGWTTAQIARLYLRTIRLQVVWQEPDRHPSQATEGNIYSFWHENILLATGVGANHGICVLVSQSRDGSYITSVIENLGFGTVRGSNNRGAVRALRQLLNQDPQTLLAFTPDGPRGPRHEFQGGAVFVASRTGLPVIPVGFAYERAWHASSWDQFAIAKPFSRAVCYAGEPVFVPEGIGADEIAKQQQLAAEAMHAATRHAESLLKDRHPKS